ncbi:MAG: molybdopterin molybdotransferase MoeA [Bacteroidales bacterium]|nr:molybdopterin molybdotransferase MoeA [Bacteroidales bacterium]
MISYEEALKLVLENAHTLGIETVSFENSINRVLAVDVVSDVDMPPFNKAAMDGYACRNVDLKNELEVIEVIPAGHWPEKTICENQCSKIMTGAPLPQGADTVIMIEYVKEVAPNKIVFSKEDTKSNVCLLGDDVKTGDVVLKKGTFIKAKHIPVLASAGATQIEVFRQPVVAVVSTGNELVEPEIRPQPSQIRNSNGYQLVAQVKELGLSVRYFGIARDTFEDTDALFQKAIAEADVLIMSGAVSVGDYDFVPEVLKKSGFDIHFHGVSVKPGKRTIFGTHENKWFVGVPGNPVSSYVQFETLIKPLLLKIEGYDAFLKILRLPLEDDFRRKNANRKAYEPIVITSRGTAKKMEYHGSAHINSLSYADGLMEIELGISEIKKGTLVNVRPI